MITIALATAMSPSAEVWAADDISDVQELQREVRQARADLQALQGAFAEMTELERQGSANLAKALPEQSTPAQPAPRPPAAPIGGSEVARGTGEPILPPAPSVTRDEQGRGASRQRRQKRSRSKATRKQAGKAR